jgi:hypothetical protein
MLALHPRVVEAVWQAVEAFIPPHVARSHPLGCHRGRISDRFCFEGILRRLVTGCSWDVAGRISEAGRPRCAVAAMSGWPPGCSTASSSTPWPPMTASSAWTSPRSLWTVPSTRRPSVVKGPARTRLTEANSGGSGRWPPTGPGSRSGGRSPAPTAMTVSCSTPPSTRRRRSRLARRHRDVAPRPRLRQRRRA